MIPSALSTLLLYARSKSNSPLPVQVTEQEPMWWLRSMSVDVDRMYINREMSNYLVNHPEFLQEGTVASIDHAKITGQLARVSDVDLYGTGFLPAGPEKELLDKLPHVAFQWNDGTWVFHSFPNMRSRPVRDPFIEVDNGISVQASSTITIMRPSITRKSDGFLMTKWDASLRYLTIRESLAYRLLGCWPRDALPTNLED